jgi:hypothetical protein
MVHVPVLRVAGNVEKIEFHRFAVRRRLGDHARPVSGIAIVCQEKTFAIVIPQ